MAGSEAPPFEPLNDLERLLVLAATEPDQRPAFTRAILDALLYAVSPDAGPVGERTLKADETVSLVMVPIEEGKAATAVFTAPERVAQIYGRDSHYLGMRGADLIALVADNPLLLNPGLPYGVLWSPEDLALLLGRPVARTAEAGATVMLGSPAQRPDDLIARLAEAFGPVDGVKGAWLALAQWPQQAEFAWYLDLRSDLPRDALTGVLGKALEGADLRGLNLDMTVQPADGPPGTGIAVVEPRP